MMPAPTPRPADPTAPAVAGRRPLLRAGLGAALAAIALPALAQGPRRTVLAPMTEGPFYPSRSWRDGSAGERLTGRDWDFDLTRIERGGGRVLTARGEHLGLEATVVDSNGRTIDGAEVEIWQCDVQAAYRHARVSADPGTYDEGFQGFGAAKSGKDGAVRFRTIKPVPYPGRTPHIHVKLRHASFGELTSQLFLAGDPGNARDFLWRRLEDAERRALEMTLAAAPAESGLRWTARHALVVPA